MNSAALHPNQAEIISGQQNGTVRIWDLTAGKHRLELNPDGEVATRSVQYSPNGSIAVSANNKGTAFVWQAESPDFDLAQKIQAHNSYLLKVAMSPNSKYVLKEIAGKPPERRMANRELILDL